MAFIMHLDNLYDSLNEVNFGIVGLEIDTGRLHYYSHYDKDGNYDSRYYYEFDIKHIPNERLRWKMSLCKFNRNKFSELLPPKVKPILTDIVYKHAVYNEINGYPLDILSANVNHVLLDYSDGYSDSLGRKFMAEYIPLENVINLTINRDDWETNPIESEEKIIQYLIHEVGHMKVSSYEFDEKNNIIYIKSGLSTTEANLTALKITNGEIVYCPKFCNVDRNYKALEEIMNDYDCSISFANYKGSYPKLGGRLNYLCDNKLLMDRYENNDVLNNSLMKIIKSEDLYQELLEHIGDSIFGDNRKSSEQKALTLIKIYEQGKAKNINRG